MWTDRVLDIDGTRVALRCAGPTGRVHSGPSEGPECTHQLSCCDPDPCTDPSTAESVVVLHDAGAESVDAPAWEQVAAERHVVQVILPGVGDSDPVPTGATMTWMTTLLAAVIRRSGTRPTVVGTSLGGWFALETALAHPSSIGRLVLLDCAGLHSPPGYLFALFAAGQGHGGHDALIGPTMRQHGVPGDPPALAPYLADLTAAALHSWNAHVPDPSLLTRVTRLDLPTSIMWGADDSLIPVHHGRALAAAIPGAAMDIVPAAGHLLSIDAPDRVRTCVLGLPVPSDRHAS